MDYGGGIAAVVTAYLETLAREISAIQPSQLEAVTDNLSRLIAIAFGAPPAEHREPATGARITVLTYIK